MITEDLRSALEQQLKADREKTFIKLNRLRETSKIRVELDDDAGSSDLWERSAALDQIRELSHKLQTIDHALQRMIRGVYGRCEACGAAIDPRRLEAMPETTLCLTCKMMGEKPGHGRRIVTSLS